MPKHIHADLMMQYAQDAQESETPWENWERKHMWDGSWVTLEASLIFHVDCEYRRKPKTIVINGFTVNAPMDKEPDYGAEYFMPVLNIENLHDFSNYNCAWDKMNFERGLCFSNKEDAIAMAKAMLRIDPSK